MHVEASAVSLPDGVTLLDDLDRVLALVAAPQLPAEGDGDAEDEDLLEGAQAEPEVIGSEGEGEDED
jgi:hypothetical protein